MYAIVEIAGQQFKVSKDSKVFVHRLAGDEGSKITFDKILLADDNGTITLGAPAIEGASVEATVLQHLKGDKVIVFKKKRRKGYKKKNGHRPGPDADPDFGDQPHRREKVRCEKRSRASSGKTEE